MRVKKTYAEDLPYWQTSRSSDKALDEAKKNIAEAGGKITGEGFMMTDGVSAFMLQFEIDGDTFRYVEPVIESKNGNTKSAKIQAAASLKHTIKSRCVEARRKGAKKAFIGEMLLSTGQTINEMDTPELAEFARALSPSDVPVLIAGEVE